MVDHQRKIGDTALVGVRVDREGALQRINYATSKTQSQGFW